MREKILLSMVLTSIIASSSFASDINLVNNKSIYIDIDTKPGAILLESETEYKQYLIDKSKKTAEDDRRAAQLSKNCADIAMLKTAVAKLISDTKIVSDKESIDRVDINDLKNNFSELNNSVSNLSITVSELNTTKIIQASKTVQSEKKCDSEECKKINVSVVNEAVLQKSYFKLRTNKSFNVAETTSLYKYPIKGSVPFDTLKVGTKISADMTTMGGWVHAAEKGWVSGYDLSPKFEQTKDKNGKRPSNLFLTKTVKKCSKSEDLLK